MDTFSPEKRSDIMRRVHSTDTAPEKRVRSLLHKLGFRFRLRRNDLPGKPDIVLPKHRAVVFVHGCFWHRHQDCPHATTPASRQEYWLPKFRRIVERDRKNQAELRRQGWNVIVVWECEVRDLEGLEIRFEKTIHYESLANQPPDSSSAAMAAEKHRNYNVY
ncbi:MAG: DNA mismatch endonuclease Vsr [Smithellaceae bacterium]|nr:DNA mismatch endonuclease Vsr [Smithellaceae bacterium]